MDPGPDDDPHLTRVAEAALGDGRGWVAAVVVTHRHADHAEGAARFAEDVRAPVRSALRELGSPHTTPLHDGETIDADGLLVEVIATPGHTSDSVSLHLRRERVVLTGDTVLGTGSTVLMERDGGDLGDYLMSLDRLAAVSHDTETSVVGLPGHGPVIEDLGARVAVYRAHRVERLEAVRAALLDLGLPAATDDTVVRAVVERVYPDVDVSLLPAATQSVRVQLAHLARS
ncbi:MBL fold metallo-hydrolase [Luteimicrobium album]|uniref:MBL fold metallo-hydrolase n=1 Tax=Luteimicrobium album TaxID=1054550 RepID=UPI0032AEC90F